MRRQASQSSLHGLDKLKKEILRHGQDWNTPMQQSTVHVKYKQSRSVINQQKDTPTLRHKKELAKATQEEEDEREGIPAPLKTKERHIWDQPISKLYTDDCGRLPIRSRSGNEYIMIAYHCD